MVGKFVKSKAGHDKEQIYIILEEDDEYVYLSDGNRKRADKLKRKNKKHIQPIDKFISEKLFQKIAEKTISNEEIQKEISCYEKNQKNEREV